MARDNWQAYQTRIQATNNNGAGTNANHIIAIDSIEVTAPAYTPEGGTIRELYDGRRIFDDPTFGYVVTLEFGFDRVDFKPASFSTIEELLADYTAGARFDFWVRFDEENESFVTTNGDYICENMIPDWDDSFGKVAFENRGRVRDRSLTFLSTAQDFSYEDVSWIYE